MYFYKQMFTTEIPLFWEQTEIFLSLNPYVLKQGKNVMFKTKIFPG